MRFTKGVLAAVAVVAFGTTAFAQRDWDRGRYGDRDRYAPQSVSAAIDRVHADLDRAYRSGWRVSHDDRKRLDKAEHELREFADKWDRGRFDKGELDDVIGSIQHAVDNNRMGPRERDTLWNDLGMLRDMREAYNRHEIGYRR